MSTRTCIFHMFFVVHDNGARVNSTYMYIESDNALLLGTFTHSCDVSLIYLFQ